MNLRTRILIGYGMAMVLSAAALAVGVFALDPLGEATSSILRENYRSITAANTMLDVLQELRPGGPATAPRRIQELDAAFLTALTRAEDNVTIPGERGLVTDIRTLYYEYRHVSSATAGGDDRSSLERRLRERIMSLRRLNRDRMYSAAAEAERLAGRAVWMIVIPGIAALAAMLLFSLVLSYRLVQPLRGMVQAARDIGEGRLGARLPEDRQDEFGVLAAEFNRMAVEVQRFRDMNIEEVLIARNKSDAVLSNIDDGIILVGTDLHVASVNPAALRLLGRAPVWAAADVPLQQFLPVPELHAVVRSAFADGISIARPDEQRIFEVPGTNAPLFCQYSVELILDAGRQPREAIIVLRDVTRLKEVERLKTEFVMSASHELRTPLTSIGMSIELLAENIGECASERDRSLLATAREEVTRLRVLVEDLLNLSKIESGRIDMEFSPVQLDAILDRIMAIFTPQCAEKRVTLRREDSGKLPNVRADASKIALVLTNLVSNALRYVPSGGSIVLSASAAARIVHVRVRDDGPGIPLEYQTRIFDRFMQVPGADDGSGLGLAISKEIVKAHGGTIWVESLPGAGSTFTFTLPLITQEA